MQQLRDAVLRLEPRVLRARGAGADASSFPPENPSPTGMPKRVSPAQTDVLQEPQALHLP